MPNFASRAAVDGFYLNLFLLGAIIFFAWERLAILSWTPIHTISFWAHEYWWYKVLIAVGLPIAFGIWFFVHASRDVPK